MSKLTHEQLNIQDAFEDGDLMPLFEEYILKDKKPPKSACWTLSRLERLSSPPSITYSSVSTSQTFLANLKENHQTVI